MDPEFWHQKWKNKEIGFHQEVYTPELVEFFSQLNCPPKGQVLVPLCGKSKDLFWLYQKGYQVFGVELSELAVMEFFQENDLIYQITEKPHHKCFHTPDDRLKIYCGDLFDFEKDCEPNDIMAIFDRASIVALPQDLRLQYAKLLRKIAPQASSLLLTFEYPQEKMQGPPFSVMESEIHQLFSDKEIKILKVQKIEDNRFESLKGEEVYKKTFHIQPR